MHSSHTDEDKVNGERCGNNGLLELLECHLRGRALGVQRDNDCVGYQKFQVLEVRD